MLRYCHILIFIFLASYTSTSEAQTQNEIFTQLVGHEITMDPDMVARVLKDIPGKKFFADTNNDGLIDVIYKIDNDERHGELRQPLLVKIVDEDGDMHLTREGDLDSDLYIADWYADGSIDRIVDYVDMDNDNDVDEQLLYQWSENEGWKKRMPRYYPGKIYLVTWAKDYGDDNRLWYHANYEYSQRITQWKTDFNGDEMYVYLFFYDYEENTITPTLETAFTFYDLDGDTYSEELAAFFGTGIVIDMLRYSMDIDNDTIGNNCHDYDFSLSCLGPISLPLDKCHGVGLRGHTTEPIIRWDYARSVAKEGKWSKIHLTWDENDNNIDPLPGRKHHERWEGVISYGNEYMKQVGGPSCGPYNKRNEIDIDASGHMQFYYSPVDQRLHLYGAEVGWLKVDYDYDDSIDMIIRMDDQDSNGFFDTWKYDVDGDSLFERTVRLEDDTGRIYPFDYHILHDEYTSTLNRIIPNNQQFIDVIKKVLESTGKTFAPDEVEEYFHSSLIHYGKEFHLGEKIKSSQEGTRYYQDIIKERYWHRLIRTPVAQKDFFQQVKTAYEKGDIEGATGLLEKHLLRK